MTDSLQHDTEHRQRRTAAIADGGPLLKRSKALSAETRAKYIAAGLPLPSYEKRAATGSGRAPKDATERLTYDARVGAIVHQVIAKVANPARTMPSAERARLVEEVVLPLTRSRRDLGRGDRTAMRVTGLVSQYLTRFLPSVEAEFLGAEMKAGEGRTDLAWRLPGFGVWFDELKTWRGVGELFDDATMRQVYGYLDHGVDAYGAEFQGVRLLTLGNSHATRLIAPTGVMTALGDAPFRGVTGQKEVA